MSEATATKCANCGRDIVRPRIGSYPEAVKWVHVISPIGAGNRYCDSGGRVAAP